MDNITKEKLTNIISREIQVEDSMLALYCNMVQKSIMTDLSAEDKNLAEEILNILIRDTERHKETMNKVIGNL